MGTGCVGGTAEEGEDPVRDVGGRLVEGAERSEEEGVQDREGNEEGTSLE